MTRIKNWEAKRAGGRITINGVDAETDKPIKVVGVDVIEAREGRIVATRHEQGDENELILDGSLAERIKAILAVGPGDRDRDAALAAGKLDDIRRLVG
jgi:hypothetical protein